MKIVLAYSGGLDTSVIVKWLRETYDAEIITFAADIGQEEELKGLSRKARRTGASKHYTLDLVEEFARDFIYPMIRAERGLRGPVLPRDLDRPAADREGPDRDRPEGEGGHGRARRHRQGQRPVPLRAHLHGACARAARSSPRGRSTPSGQQFPGRAEMIAYCQKHKIPVEASLKKPYSMDRNLLHISYEAGILEDPWFDPTTKKNKGMFKLSVSPEDAPNRSGVRRARLREGRLRRRERQEAHAGGRPAGRSTSSAASTASGGSTWSRTASSG